MRANWGRTRGQLSAVTPVNNENWVKVHDLEFWMWWTGACAAGGALLGVLPLLNQTWQMAASLPYGVAMVLTLLIPGWLFAVPQWLVLRSRLELSSRWLVATALGGAGGLLLSFLVGFPLGGGLRLLRGPEWLLSPIAGLVIGSAVGAVQAPILRHYRTVEQSRWILSSALGGLAMVTFGAVASGLDSAVSIAGGLIIGGWLYGMITGLALCHRRL